MRSLIFLLLFSSQAFGAIIDLGDYTRDTATGLDWLDLTKTRGLSFDEVSTELDFGGKYYGHRYANTAEFDQLITNFDYVAINNNCQYGLINCDVSIDTDNPIVEHMIRLLGDTYDAYLDFRNDGRDIAPNGAGAVDGLLADTPLTNDVNYAGYGYIYDDESFLRFDQSNYIDSADHVSAANNPMHKSSTSEVTGSFLVRPSPVPLPASFWLFASGLISLRLFRL